MRLLRGKRYGCLGFRLRVDDVDLRITVVGLLVGSVGALHHAQQQVNAFGELHHLLV